MEVKFSNSFIFLGLLFLSNFNKGQTITPTAVKVTNSVSPYINEAIPHSPLFKAVRLDPNISERDPRKYIMVIEENGDKKESNLVSPQNNGNVNQLFSVDCRSKIKVLFDIEALKNYKEFKGFLSISAKAGDRNIEVNPYFITGSPQSLIGISSKHSVVETSKAISNILATGYNLSFNLDSLFKSIKVDLIYGKDKDKKEDLKRILNSEFFPARNSIYNGIAVKAAPAIAKLKYSNDYRESEIYWYKRDSIMNSYPFNVKTYLLAIAKISEIQLKNNDNYKKNVEEKIISMLAIKKDIDPKKYTGSINLSDIEDVNSIIKNLASDDQLFVNVDKTYNLADYINEAIKSKDQEEMSSINYYSKKGGIDSMPTKDESINEKILIDIRMNLDKLNLLLKNNDDPEINALLINTVFYNTIAYKQFMGGFIVKIDDALVALNQDNKLTSKEIKSKLVNLYSLQSDLKSFQTAIIDLVTDKSVIENYKLNDARDQDALMQVLNEIICNSIATERFGRLLTATIDLSKQDLRNGDYLNIYVNWDNSDLNADPKSGSLPLELVKLKVTKIGWFPEVSESFMLVKNLFPDNLDPKTSKGSFKGQYGVNFLATFYTNPNKKRNVFQFNDKDQELDSIEFKTKDRCNFLNALKPSIGINLCYLDFSDETIEIGTGLVVGLFKNKIHLTGGYNLFAKKNPWYFGVGFSFVNLINFFPKNNDNSFSKVE